MSGNESERKEYTVPAITRRETLETLGVTGAGAGMLAGSTFPSEGRGPPDSRGEGEDGSGGEESGRGPPEDSNGRGPPNDDEEAN